MEKVKNPIKRTRKELVEGIDYLEEVKCVDAVILDEQGNVGNEYTWVIPYEIDFAIEIGDTLVVEEAIGQRLTFARAVSRVYEKTKAQHEEDDIHPHRAVITNLGVRL
jgi:hypothetical protein